MKAAAMTGRRMAKEPWRGRQWWRRKAAWCGNGMLVNVELKAGGRRATRWAKTKAIVKIEGQSRRRAWYQGGQ